VAPLDTAGAAVGPSREVENRHGIFDGVLSECRSKGLCVRGSGLASRGRPQLQVDARSRAQMDGSALRHRLRVVSFPNPYNRTVVRRLCFRVQEETSQGVVPVPTRSIRSEAVRLLRPAERGTRERDPIQTS